MNGPRQSKKRLPIYLLTALLILTLVFPTTAGAYISRSTGESIPGYGIARSQPQYQGRPSAPSFPSPRPEEPADPVEPAPTQPVPPPSQPAYSFNGSSYGRARSNSQGFYNPSPQPPPSDPVTPPVQPEPPKEPENPVEPPDKPKPPPAGETVTLNSQERQLFDLVNSERVSRGLAPLQLDAQLTYLARLKSQDMINHNYFAHESPTYGRSGDMLRNAGVMFSIAAENIGIGGSINAIFNAFMNSSGHRNKIISSRYTRTGVGVIYQPGRGYLVTQLFLLPR